MPPTPDRPDFDPQDQAEALDEDNTVGSGDDIPPAEMRTFEEVPQLRDETSEPGDTEMDDAPFGEALSDDERMAQVRDPQNAASHDRDRPVFDAAREGDGPRPSEDDPG